jgi:hypothetical protein
VHTNDNSEPNLQATSTVPRLLAELTETHRQRLIVFAQRRVRRLAITPWTQRLLAIASPEDIVAEKTCKRPAPIDEEPPASGLGRTGAKVLGWNDAQKAKRLIDSHGDTHFLLFVNSPVTPAGGHFENVGRVGAPAFAQRLCARGRQEVFNHSPYVMGLEWLHQNAKHPGLTGKGHLFEGIGKDEYPATPLHKVQFRGEWRELSGVDVDVRHENIELAGASCVARLTAIGGQADFAALRSECANHVPFNG